MKQLRIFSLDFPKISKKEPRIRSIPQKEAIQKSSQSMKKQVNVTPTTNYKQNHEIFKPLEFNGLQNSRSRNYSGSLVVTLACRTNKIKDSMYISKITQKSPKKLNIKTEPEGQLSIGYSVGGKKLSLSNLHKKIPNQKAFLPFFANNSKKAKLQIHYISKHIN